ncbi:retrovirus-related pol polyprotein from transposon TNT 1-94 [Tanacetum coccineum]
MTTSITTNATYSQMHNNIMAAGSRDHTPMLATRRCAQWQSRFMRYVDTKPNGEALRKCIVQGPYKLSNIIIPGQPATDESPVVPEQTIHETLSNITPENKAHYDAGKEVIHLLLTGIGDEIYSTVDACRTAHDMWIAIERLQQGESLNKQDVNTGLFWEFGRFTSRDGELIESYYSRMVKICDNCQANSKFRHNTCYQEPKPHKSYAPSSKQSSSTRSHVSTGHKGNEIAKPITLPSESASEEDNDPKQAQRDKEMQKNLALIAKKSKRVKDYTYRKEKMLLCKQAEKGVPLQAEQDDWLEDVDEETQDLMLSHWKRLTKNAKECEDERVVLVALIVNLQLDTEENKKIQKQLKKANTSLAQELKECKSTLEETNRTLGESNRTRDRYLVALHDKDVELAKYKTFKDHTIKNDTLERKLKETLGLLAQKEHDIKECLKIKAYEISVVKETNNELDKHSLLTKSTYEGIVKEKNKVIKDLKLKEGYDLDKLIADVMCSYLHSLSDLDAHTELQYLYLHKIKECECLAEKLFKQTKNVSKEVYNELLRSFAKLEQHLISLEIALQQCQEQIKNDTVCKQNESTIFLKEREQYFEIQDLKAQLHDKNIAISELNKLIKKMKGKTVDTKFDKPSIVRQPNAQSIPKPSVLGTEFLNKTLHAYFKEEGIEHQTSTPRTLELNGVVERQNRTLVEAARMMFSTSKLPLFFWAEAIATACYTQNRSLIILRHEKIPYHIINGRKPSLKHLYIFGCTCYITRDGKNLDKMKEKWDSCILVGYSSHSKGYKVYNTRTRLIVESIHINFDEIKELSKVSDYDNSGPAPQLQMTSAHNRSELEFNDHDNEPSSSNIVPNVSPPTDTNSLSL